MHQETQIPTYLSSHPVNCNASNRVLEPDELTDCTQSVTIPHPVDKLSTLHDAYQALTPDRRLLVDEIIAALSR